MSFSHLLLTPILATLLAGCVAVAPPGNPGPIPPHIAHSPVPQRAKPLVIHNNKGGNVLLAASRREQMAQSGRPVEIRGYCWSACTMFLTMPNACLAPDARVGFHAPRIPNTTIIPPIVDQIMARYYRGKILEKWQSEWRGSLKMHKMSAREYVALDPQTRLCAS